MRRSTSPSLQSYCARIRSIFRCMAVLLVLHSMSGPNTLNAMASLRELLRVLCVVCRSCSCALEQESTPFLENEAFK